MTLTQLQQLFEQSALFAMPALNEPWGLVYLEALSCRTPILGLNRNSIPELTQHGQFGFAVSEPTAESIAAALLNAFSDVDRLAKMGRDGQKHCLHTFTWEHTAMRMLDAIDAFDVAH